MRKLWMLTICLGLMFTSGCAAPVPEGAEGTAASQGETAQDIPVMPHPEGGVVVADARMYRGEVSALSAKEGGYTMTLTQVAGADYGYEKLDVALGGDAELNFSPEDLEIGNYLEVFYNSDKQPVDAIAANKLRDAADCVFNGEFVEIQNLNTGHVDGTMVIKGLDGERVIKFSFTDDTMFYFNEGLEGLEPGDLLNIYHQGVLIESEPPQGFALEVRRYEE